MVTAMKTIHPKELHQIDTANGIVVDVYAKCASNRDYLIQVDDFLEWEKKNGQIPDGSLVLLRTGFGKFWPDRVQDPSSAC